MTKSTFRTLTLSSAAIMMTALTPSISFAQIPTGQIPTAQDILDLLGGKKQSDSLLNGAAGNMRARYRAKLQSQIPGPQAKSVIDMLMENFDKANDKEKTVILQMMGIDDQKGAALVREIFDTLEQADQPNFLLKDGQKFMNLDQNVINKLDKNPVNISSNARARYSAGLRRKHPGKDGKPYRDMMLRAFGESDDKGKAILMQTIGVSIPGDQFKPNQKRASPPQESK